MPPKTRWNRPHIGTSTRFLSPCGRIDLTLNTGLSTCRLTNVSMRQRRVGLFLPDLALESLKRVRAARAIDLTGAPRETMYIDRCGRRHRIEGQGLFATLLVNRIRRLRLLHQATLSSEERCGCLPFRTEADALKTGSAGRRGPAHCSFRGGRHFDKVCAHPHAASGGE